MHENMEGKWDAKRDKITWEHGGEVEGEGEGREGYMWQDVCGGQGNMKGGLYVVGETGCMRRRSRAGCGRGWPLAARAGKGKMRRRRLVR